MSTTLATLDASAATYAAASLAPSTLEAYTRAWRDFLGWCRQHQRIACPALAGDVARYVAQLADEGRRPSTIARVLSSIRLAHVAAGELSPTDDPAVKLVVRGIRRTVGTAPLRQAAALRRPELSRCLAAIRRDDPRLYHRDRAVFLVGLAGGFRRSELCALDVADVTWHPEGVALRIRRSKADQDGHGATVRIAYGDDPTCCPVRALRLWLDIGGHEEGRLFRACDLGARRMPLGMRASMSPDAVYDIIEEASRGAGLRMSPHSLRAGFATLAAELGVPTWRVQRQGRWASARIAEGYYREAHGWTDAVKLF